MSRIRPYTPSAPPGWSQSVAVLHARMALLIDRARVSPDPAVHDVQPYFLLDSVSWWTLHKAHGYIEKDRVLKGSLPGTGREYRYVKHVGVSLGTIALVTDTDATTAASVVKAIDPHNDWEAEARRLCFWIHWDPEMSEDASITQAPPLPPDELKAGLQGLLDRLSWVDP